MFKISRTTHALIRKALREDIGRGDATTHYFIPPKEEAEAHIIAKQEGILCGVSVAETVFQLVDPAVEVIAHTKDGTRAQMKQEVCVIRGFLRSILMAERVALNFLARLSGIATLTNRFVGQIQGTQARIYDTRKTTPLWRELEKYAVRTGGGYNHRFGLYDQVLIKENHWVSIKDEQVLREKIRKIKKRKFTEIEVCNIEELKRVLPTGAHAILLDNFDIPDIREAVRIAKEFNPNQALEASGGITIENVRAIAETGVERISIGALTHSAPAFDFSLLIRHVKK